VPTALETFVDLLAAGPTQSQHVFNPWKDHDDRDHPPRAGAPRVRRENLAAYVAARARSARVMLLGEAPSHRGCRFSGIPFCSEVELRHKAGLVAREPLRATSREHAEKPMSERSAAIIWDEIDRAGCAHDVVLWNAFPWHPYHPEAADSALPSGPSSNRKPRLVEVAEGRAPFEALLRCFTHELAVYAVGKVAEDALRRWEKPACAGYIRHPSHGGEGLFRAQFRRDVLGHLGTA
jgi:hypothetical protein